MVNFSLSFVAIDLMVMPFEYTGMWIVNRRRHRSRICEADGAAQSSNCAEERGNVWPSAEDGGILCNSRVTSACNAWGDTQMFEIRSKWWVQCVFISWYKKPLCVNLTLSLCNLEKWDVLGESYFPSFGYHSWSVSYFSLTLFTLTGTCKPPQMTLMLNFN